MNWLWRTVIVLALGVAGFVAGGVIGAATVPDDAGLAAGATVLVWAVGGMVVTCVVGYIVLGRSGHRRTSPGQQGEGGTDER